MSGAPDRLKAIGAPVVHALPGVGENLQDHLQLRAIFGVTGARTLNVDYQSRVKRAMMGLDYGFRRRGPLTMAPSQLGLFAKSSPDYATANIEFHVQPLSLDRFGEPMHPYPAITVSVCNLRPESRGSTHAMSADPRARAGHPTELSVRPRRSAGGSRLDPADPPPCRGARAGAVTRRKNSSPAQTCSRTMSLCGRRAKSAPRSSTPSGPRRWDWRRIRLRWSMSGSKFTVSWGYVSLMRR